jgi:uncharacterized membrane protein
MLTKLHTLWFALRSSLWFVPSLMVAGAIALSFLTISLDEASKLAWLRDFDSIFSGGPEGARAVLATIAGSMIGVTGIVFSITVVTLTLASAQFGPRLLRTFMRDRGNQITLGTFIATFVYCLLVLRVVREVEGVRFVPHLSTTCGIAMALASLGVLIYFIHHISVSIQADAVIAAVSDDLLEALERLYPEKIGQEPPAPQHPESLAPHLADTALHARVVVATRSGYLQAVDSKGLMRLATENDFLFRLEYRPGDFVVQASPLVTVWPAARADEHLATTLNRAFILGRQRSYEQDIGFAFGQLVEIAVRALSPGVNDPFTAVSCIDRIGMALCQLAGRAYPCAARYDDAGHLRVIATTATFAEMTEATITPIRQYCRASLTVTLRLLEMIAIVAPHLHREEDREALRQQACMIERGSHEGLPEARDRQQVTASYQAVLQAIADLSASDPTRNR